MYCCSQATCCTHNSQAIDMLEDTEQHCNQCWLPIAPVYTTSSAHDDKSASGNVWTVFQHDKVACAYLSRALTASTSRLYLPTYTVLPSLCSRASQLLLCWSQQTPEYCEVMLESVSSRSQAQVADVTYSIPTNAHQRLVP